MCSAIHTSHWVHKGSMKAPLLCSFAKVSSPGFSVNIGPEISTGHVAISCSQSRSPITFGDRNHRQPSLQGVHTVLGVVRFSGRLSTDLLAWQGCPLAVHHRGHSPAVRGGQPVPIGHDGRAGASRGRAAQTAQGADRECAGADCWDQHLHDGDARPGRRRRWALQPLQITVPLLPLQTVF